MTWGWNPDTVEAAATTCAALLAAFAAYYAYRAYKAQDQSLEAQLEELATIQSEQRDTREQARRKQADGVAVWWPTGSAYNDFSAIVIGNPSGAPVYDLEVIAEYRDTRSVRRIRRADVVPPGEILRKLPGTEQTWLHKQPFDKRVDRNRQRPILWIQFRDAAGEEWTRGRTGLLCDGRAFDFDSSLRPDLRSSWKRQHNQIVHDGYDQQVDGDESESSSADES